MRHVLSAIFMAALAAAGCRGRGDLDAPATAAYEAELARWRAGQLAELRGLQGWLALAGLHWLRDGDYRLGADPAADIVLPGGAPREVGVLSVAGEQVRLRVRPGVDARVRGEAIADVLLTSDADPARPADRVDLGARFSFTIIARGDRLGVRVFDLESPERLGFTGVDHFPPDPRWVIVARLAADPAPRTIEQPTIVDNLVHRVEVPGVLVFTVAGREHRLTPTLARERGRERLQIVFSDLTSGRETYRGGRFLLAELPAGDGAVELDFNRATNPPCAFTAYATCPVPLPENHLALAVTAGDRAP